MGNRLLLAAVLAALFVPAGLAQEPPPVEEAPAVAAVEDAQAVEEAPAVVEPPAAEEVPAVEEPIEAAPAPPEVVELSLAQQLAATVNALTTALEAVALGETKATSASEAAARAEAALSLAREQVVIAEDDSAMQSMAVNGAGEGVIAVIRAIQASH